MAESVISRSIIDEIKWRACKISPHAVQCDERFQPREKLSEPRVRDYARKMERGERFEPIVLGKVGRKGPYVLDGFHRVEAARLAGVESLDARVAPMSVER